MMTKRIVYVQQKASTPAGSINHIFITIVYNTQSQVYLFSITATQVLQIFNSQSQPLNMPTTIRVPIVINIPSIVISDRTSNVDMQKKKCFGKVSSSRAFIHVWGQFFIPICATTIVTFWLYR